MKIIIETDLNIPVSAEVDTFTLNNLLEKYSVYFRIGYDCSGDSYLIFAQKVTGDEVFINNFLSLLDDLVNFDLKFIPQGDGCETMFSMVPHEKFVIKNLTTVKKSV